MAASDNVPILLKNRLHLAGRPQMVPVRELPYRPAAPSLHQSRTDGSIRQRANPPKKPLALGGASTDEYTPLMSTRP